MAQLSIPRLPQQITMAEEPDLNFYPANSYDQYRANPSPAAINFNPFAPSLSSSSTTVASAVDPLTFDSGCFSDADSESDRDVSYSVSDLFEELHSSERFRGFVDGHGLSSAASPSSEPANEYGIWGFEDEDFNGMNYVEDLGFTIGVEPGISISESDLDVQDVDSRISGLPIIGVDSESESDAEEQINAIFELNSGDNRENDINGVESSNNLWNGFGLQEQRNVYEDFEWEELEDRVGRETPNVVADGLEELSEAPGMSSEQERQLEAARTLEHGILVRINDYSIYAMMEHGIDREYVLAVENNFTNTFDDDAPFGQILDNENDLRGSPPAARSVVENLPLVELKMEDLKDDNVVCAICKDDMPLEEKAKKLPCCHYYHEDCILPWLNIRNTCPACRYELPTDDPDYERRKTQRARDRVELDLQVQNVYSLI